MAMVTGLEQSNGVNPAGLGIQLARLVRLHAELALGEVRSPLVAAAVAVAVGVLALMAGMAAAVVLIAAGVAPFVGARWQHLAIAGGGALLVAFLAMTWERVAAAPSRAPPRDPENTERDLDAIHRHVPKRSWLSYSALVGGLGVGLFLSRMPMLARWSVEGSGWPRWGPRS